MKILLYEVRTWSPSFSEVFAKGKKADRKVLLIHRHSILKTDELNGCAENKETIIT